MPIGTIRRDLEGAEARLPLWMAAIACAAVVALLITGYPRAAAGLALGAGIALLGYRWLHQMVVTVMNQSETAPSRIPVAKLLVRYPLAIFAVFVFYREGWLPFQAVLAGLFIPAAGALAESLYQIGSAVRHSKAV